MGRLILLLLITALACKRLIGRWPWEMWMQSERAQAELQARALLKVDRQAGREAIADAHRKLLAQVHPDRGGTAEQVHAANRARDMLLARIDRTDGKP